MLIYSHFHRLTLLTSLCLLTTVAGARAEDAIDSLLWRASASSNLQKVDQALDGKEETRWDSGTRQAEGQWFQIDLGETRSVSRLVLDAGGSAGDYARLVEVLISPDGQTWSSGGKTQGETITSFPFSPTLKTRYLRFTIPSGAKLSGGFWSIHEIHLYSDQPGEALPRPAIRWRTIKPHFPTRDVVIAGFDIRDFGIDPAKGQDATAAIRVATALLAKVGGGTLWLPEGHYRLSEPITLRNNVTLRGDWCVPQPGQPIKGTILEMTAGRGQAEGPEGINLYEGSAAIGLAFWYPEQDAGKIVPYPAALKQYGGVGMCVENVTFVNAYRGFTCGPESCALFFVRNAYGTVLETGVSIDSTVDIGRLEKVRFSPHYWPGSGLPGAPAVDGPHIAWMKQHGAGLLFRRNDWSYAYDVEIDGYQTGLRTAPSLGDEDVKKNRKSYANGNNAQFRFAHCQTAIHLENVSNCGMMLYGCEIVDCETGIIAEATFTNAMQFQNCRIIATPQAIRLQGPGQLLFVNSEITGTVENGTGYLSFAGGRTSAAAATGSAPGIGQTLLLPDPGIPEIKNPYHTPDDRIAPPTDDLVIVTDPAFGAKGDATADDTAAVKKAIAAVSITGGTVFFPGGEYQIAENLVVPTGVELRGVSESPHHAQTRGSVIDVLPGRGSADGPAFLTLSANSGLRGLTFHYPEQDATNIVPYPWMIRGAGEGVWAVNLSCTMAYLLLDLATNRCDRHYVDYVAGHALLEAFRIGSGSQGGRLLNCQLNPNYYAFTNSYANSPSRISPKDSGKYSDPVYAFAKQNARAFVIGDCTNQILFQNFVFGMKQGLTLTGEKIGPSGWCLGHGSDQCQWSTWIDRIGAGGMPLINSQLVTVRDNGPERGYIRLDAAFTGTAYFLGMDAWGDPSAALTVLGGKLVLASSLISRSGAATLVLQKEGKAQLNSVVLRDVDMLVEREDNSAANFQLDGVVLSKNGATAAYPATTDIPANLIGLKVPGTQVGIAFDLANSLPNNRWQLTASVNQRDGQKAIDHDPATRWSTGKPAQPGDEVTLDLGENRVIAQLRLETLASRNDFLKRMSIYLSTDGHNWGDPIYAGRGETDLRIGFIPREARFVRIVNTETKVGSYWSIHEIQVSGK